MDLENFLGMYRACNVNHFSGVDQSRGMTLFESLCVERVSIVTSVYGAAEELSESSMCVVVQPTPEKCEECIWDIDKNPDFYQGIARRGYQNVRDHLSYCAFTANFTYPAHGTLEIQKPNCSSEGSTQVRWEKGE